MNEFEPASEFVTVKVDQLIPADWNPKVDGSDEKMESLINSIMEDGSYGVPCIRHLKSGELEVIDGNHRLRAIQRLGLEEVRVEDFGKISKGKAASVAHRRNAQWFEEDYIAAAQLLVNDILPEYDSISDLAAFMPESLVTLENMVDSAAGLFNFHEDGPPPPKDTTLTERISFPVDPATYKLWLEWKETCKAEGAERDVDCLIALLTEAMTTND